VNMLRRLIVLVAALIFPLRAVAQTENDFFNPEKLQEIHIEIFPTDWETLKKNFRDDTYYACEFHWIYNGKDLTMPEVGIRSRGNGSRSGVKPSLKVDFNHYESNQHFLGSLSNVVLRANTQDASMMHERVSMALFGRMGLHAPRETHTKLYVNGAYVGLYTIVESIDKPYLRTSYGEDGGYLYNYQYADVFVFEDRGSNPATYSPVPFEPETNKQTPNPAPLATMVQAINKTSDAQFVSTVSQYVDFNSFLTEIAAENFVADQDSLIGDYGLNNFYLYRFNGKNVHTFIPWDKSNAFWSLDWPIMHNFSTNVLSRRSAANPDLLAIYLNAVARAANAAGGPGGWLEQEINKEYQQIRDAAYADPLKLCDPGATGTLRSCSNDEFDAAVASMVTFARRRAIDVQIQLAGGASQQTFAVSNLGGFTSTAGGSTFPLRVGYARIQPTGTTTPNGLAIFSLRNGSMVVSEAAVPASSLIQNGRIYAEVNAPVNTGIAIANPNNQDVLVAFYFTDATGRDFGAGATTIPANGQIAEFLDSSRFNSGTLATGTFTFSSTLPIAAIALRLVTTDRSEYLMTTLPVAPVTAQGGNVMFPYFVDGLGYTTQVVLVNPSDQVLTGSLQFFSQGSSSAAATAVAVATVEKGTASSFTYSIPAHSSFRLRTTGSLPDLRLGSIRVVPAAGSSTPSGVSVFSLKSGSTAITEAGVPAVPLGSAFRLYAESSGDFVHFQAGSTQTGISVANSNTTPATVSFELFRLDGTSLGSTGSLTIPANGERALYLNAVPGLPALPATFQGVLRISGPAGISVVGLRGRYNERGDFLITTTAPIPEDAPAPTGELLFPHIAEGDGFTTQFILFSGTPGLTSSGSVRYIGQNGMPLPLSIR